jgi:hypothetical protein
MARCIFIPVQVYKSNHGQGGQPQHDFMGMCILWRVASDADDAEERWLDEHK